MSGTFDVHSARSNLELPFSQHNLQSNWGELERKLRSREREIDGATDEELETEEEGPGAAEQDSTESSSTTLEGELRRFETEDKPFWEVFNCMSSKLSDTIASKIEESYLAFVNSPEHKLNANVKDHLKRSLLHVAVEQDHESFAKCLVDMVSK